MGFLKNFLKKGKTQPEKRKKQVVKELKNKEAGAKPAKVEVKKKVKEVKEKKDKVKPVRPRGKISVIAPKVLKEPHVTEKATELTKENQYIFKVWPRSNKIEIKKAVEQLYRVDVEGVRIVNVPARKRRLGRIQGWRKGYKKAIVKIAKNQKIEVLPR